MATKLAIRFFVVVLNKQKIGTIWPPSPLHRTLGGNPKGGERIYDLLICD